MAREIGAEIALRLGRYFSQTAQYWLNFQARHDLDCALDATKLDLPPWMVLDVIRGLSPICE